MSDPFPSSFEIEFDRAALRRYLRAKWLLSWTLSLGILGALFGSMGFQRAAQAGSGEWLPVVSTGAMTMGTGLAIGVALGAILYLAISHREAARLAESQRLRVEGSFLRIIRGGWAASDQKIHFRAIVDYTVIETPFLRRFGIAALKMTTTASHPNGFLVIHGMANAESVRDQLAEIDSLRETG